VLSPRARLKGTVETVAPHPAILPRQELARFTRAGQLLWVHALLERKPTKVAAVALANKTARIVWVVMMRGDGYWAKPVLLGQPGINTPGRFRMRG
jgi:hypothetical protein